MHFKNFQAKQTTQDKPIKFVASTASPDRYGDVVDQKGWDLSAYNRNPVVLFNHNPSQMPIGKGKAYVENDQLMLEVEFDQKDDMAKTIEQKVRDGYINAVSVGFQPSKTIARSSLPSDHPYHGKSGQYFQASELLEVSIVTIPANNEATLSKQFTRGIGLADVAKSLIQSKKVVSITETKSNTVIVEFAKPDPQPQKSADTPNVLRELVGSMVTDGIEMPLYNSKEEAEEKAEEMGGSGSHEHTLDGETVYMPFESHEQIMEIMGDKEEEEEEEREHTDDHDDDEEKYREEDSEDKEKEMEEEESEEEKYMSLDDFLRELRQFNK
jgi:HK97 family phage prohead protease